jgi:flagellar protein FliO/FliZ
MGMSMAGVLASAHCVAATNPVEPSFAGGLAQTLLGLGVVLALIWGAAWLLRRLNVGAPSAGSAIRVLATQALGQRERVVLVEVADQWLVLGVAPGRVSALSTLPKGALPPRAATPAPFASLLARARQKSGDSAGDA